MVSLDKPDLPSTGKVDLSKGQGVTLRKDGAALTKVKMGVGWDPAVRGRNIDLDASCVLLDASGKKVDAVWFMKLASRDGTVQHSGDNVTGEGSGNDEVITVDLAALPKKVVLVAFTVNSFRGQALGSISRAYCNLRTDSGSPLAHYDLGAIDGKHRGVVLATMEREPGGTWSMTARGDAGKGRTYRGLMDIIQGYPRPAAG